MITCSLLPIHVCDSFISMAKQVPATIIMPIYSRNRKGRYNRSCIYTFYTFSIIAQCNNKSLRILRIIGQIVATCVTSAEQRLISDSMHLHSAIASSLHLYMDPHFLLFSGIIVYPIFFLACVFFANFNDVFFFSCCSLNNLYVSIRINKESCLSAKIVKQHYIEE